MTRSNSYWLGLEKNEANFVALSPLSFIERSASVYPDRIATIYGSRRQTGRETYARARRLASSLKQRGIGDGDTVAAVLPNVPAMFEAHFGVPMSGAVLNTPNTRLDAEAIALMLEHGETKVLLTDREFSSVIGKALAMLGDRRPFVIEVDDEDAPAGKRLGDVSYESFLGDCDADFDWKLPADEWNAIALNYASGTTGNPKGVVTHHRGAYLNAVSNVVTWEVPRHSVYLWTLPMFHCNGWRFPWTLALQAGVSVCLRKVDTALIFKLIREQRVTHLCGAPIVYGMLIDAPEAQRTGITHAISGLIAGSAPPGAIIEGCGRIGIAITHVYGLTESYGPAAVCAQQPEWAALPAADRATLNARQGVAYPTQEAITAMDPETMQPVPADGESMGEIFFRGNLLMKGHLKNSRATEESFAGGWFHTGDLAVLQAHGYVKIKDRSKDVIISGGENILSVEVEEVLYRHPAVLMAAVIAKPDPKWGEVAAAFVELRAGATATEAEIVEHCRAEMARFKVPKQVIFGPMPKTSTGKIQKFVLREQLNSASAIDSKATTP